MFSTSNPCPTPPQTAYCSLCIAFYVLGRKAYPLNFSSVLPRGLCLRFLILNQVYWFHQNAPFNLISLLRSQRNLPSYVTDAQSSLRVKRGWLQSLDSVGSNGYLPCQGFNRSSQHRSKNFSAIYNCQITFVWCLIFILFHHCEFLYIIFLYIFYFFAHLLGNRRRVCISPLNQAM